MMSSLRLPSVARSREYLRKASTIENLADATAGHASPGDYVIDMTVFAAYRAKPGVLAPGGLAIFVVDADRCALAALCTKESSTSRATRRSIAAQDVPVRAEHPPDDVAAQRHDPPRVRDSDGGRNDQRAGSRSSDPTAAPPGSAHHAHRQLRDRKLPDRRPPRFRDEAVQPRLSDAHAHDQRPPARLACCRSRSRSCVGPTRAR